MPVLNVLDGVVALEFGETITLTVVDETGTAVDISGYLGTNEVTFRHKDGQTTVTRTLSFPNAGTDGKVTFTFVAGNVNKPGKWEGREQLRNVGGESIT